MVRLTSYSTIKQFLQGNLPPGQPMPSWMTFGIGATAGIITVCALRSAVVVIIWLTHRYHHAFGVSAIDVGDAELMAASSRLGCRRLRRSSSIGTLSTAFTGY